MNHLMKCSPGLEEASQPTAETHSKALVKHVHSARWASQEELQREIKACEYPLKGGEDFISPFPFSLSLPTNQDLSKKKKKVLSTSEQMPLNFWIASFSLYPPKCQIS